MIYYRKLLLVFVFLWPIVSFGLGSHEVTLLVNENSQKSLEVANHFIKLRQIPQQNIIYLDLPDSVLSEPWSITIEQYRKMIWQPVNKTINERGLDKHILAWIYSVDFPIRVESSGSQTMSIMGATLLGGTFPSDDAIKYANYRSHYYAGPDTNDTKILLPRTIDRFLKHSSDSLPVPSMMLGFVGKNGTDVNTVLNMLQRGNAVDGAFPKGTVYLVKSDDVRSKCRHWQYLLAKKLIEDAGLSVSILDSLPNEKSDIIGLLCGSAGVDPLKLGSYVSGAMAENLTSFSGAFDKGQTKLTSWIKAGAIASAGTVTEPFSIWKKFPNAIFFAHYRSGCTIIESYYQSVYCPLQLLMVGDPLANPWSPSTPLVLVALEDDPQKGVAEFFVQSMRPAKQRSLMTFYLNGKRLMGVKGMPLRLNTKHLPDGYHELRAVSYTLDKNISHLGTSLKNFTVNNMGRTIELDLVGNVSIMDKSEIITLKYFTKSEYKSLKIMNGMRYLKAKVIPEKSIIEFNPNQLGKGPVQIQLLATYEDEMQVRSNPVELILK